ncbi:PAS domain S-box-containing protein [Syntrophus gentianae]|uniref:histidine kinase n=1 Tax=Syntrophus gentianae TaxID=43775 RepID=A0A1H7YT02_9BACT|nr:CHASE2 domain-containing protein [Syntrophus gentianae]SEM49093.1 PAS domain S-box-containing protein [Syntrophus gentianae]
MERLGPLLRNVWRSRHRLYFYGFMVTVLFSLLYILEPPFFRFLELRFYDAILHENPVEKPATDIVIIDIDERSLQAVGQWPWPRHVIARLFKGINAQGPSAIGVDLLFSEADHRSVSRFSHDIQEKYGASPRVKPVGPEDMSGDALLARTLSTGPFVLARKFFFNGEAFISRECVFQPLSVVLLGTADFHSENQPFHKASGVVCNLPIFDAAVTSTGFINASFDIDGLMRRIPLIMRYEAGSSGGSYFPSLVLATLMKQKNLRQVFVKVTSTGNPYEILLGGTAIPVDDRGNMLIHYRDREQACPHVSALDILSGRQGNISLKGKIVFVGTSATGLGERTITPVHPFLPGVDIHATAAQNILQSNFVKRPPWISGLELFFILLAGLLSTILFARTNAKGSLLFALALLIGLIALSYGAFRTDGLVISPLIPLLTVAVNFSLLNLSKFWQAERDLRQSENRYRSIFNNALEGICQITPDGLLTAANSALARMMGFETPADFLAALPTISSIRLENPEDRQKILGLLSEQGEIRGFETEVHTAKGTRIWVSINAVATKNNGKITFYEVSIEDVSERRRSEEALQESRQRFSDILEFLPDATLVIDRNGRVIAWNRAMESMTGIRKEEMLGKGDLEYARPFYGDRRPILIDLVLSPDEEIEAQYTAIQRRGDRIFGEAYVPGLPPGDVHISATASVLRDPQGAVMAAIECVRNNTERKRMEERLRRAEKMESLGTMAGGVAHDLNNVLGVLVGYAEMMMLEIPEGNPLRRYAVNIHQSGIRGAAMIQDLLTLARRGVAVSEVVNLRELASSYFNSPDFAKLKEDHPQVSFRMDLQDDLMNIKGSPTHLSKTLMNLIPNAAEAISGPGEVVIRMANCYLDLPVRGYAEVKEGDYVVLSVADSGQGISPQDMERIFEPFYTKKVMGKSGTGLGLAIVWGTVKDHDGYIDVTSQEGVGSVFTLYFPATREGVARNKEQLSLDQYMGSGESLLVVDDNEGQRHLAASILTKLNYQVATVSCGEEAVSYLMSHEADLLLLDMIMDPGIDGLETYRRILEIHPRQKAIIISGYSETDRVKKVQELGAGGFLRKPYTLEKLGLAIQEELSKSSVG